MYLSTSLTGLSYPKFGRVQLRLAAAPLQWGRLLWLLELLGPPWKSLHPPPDSRPPRTEEVFGCEPLT